MDEVTNEFNYCHGNNAVRIGSKIGFYYHVHPVTNLIQVQFIINGMYMPLIETALVYDDRIQIILNLRDYTQGVKLHRITSVGPKNYEFSIKNNPNCKHFCQDDEYDC